MRSSHYNKGEERREVDRRGVDWQVKHISRVSVPPLLACCFVFTESKRKLYVEEGEEERCHTFDYWGLANEIFLIKQLSLSTTKHEWESSCTTIPAGQPKQHSSISPSILSVLADLATASTL